MSPYTHAHTHTRTLKDTHTHTHTHIAGVTQLCKCSISAVKIPSVFFEIGERPLIVVSILINSLSLVLANASPSQDAPPRCQSRETVRGKAWYDSGITISCIPTYRCASSTTDSLINPWITTLSHIRKALSARSLTSPSSLTRPT